MKLCGSYEQDLKIMDNMLAGDMTVKKRRFGPAGRPDCCCIYFSDGLSSSQLISQGIIGPVVRGGALPKKGVLDHLKSSVLELPEVEWKDETDEIMPALAYGDLLLFADGQAGCLVIGSKSFSFRSISEPDDEKVAKGPKEGFVEPLMINVSMLKRRLRTRSLKLEMTQVGDKSGTSCCICYIEDCVDKSVLKRVRKGISSIKVDGIFDSSYISEMLDPHPFSIFRRSGKTARPDVAAAKLLEGRVVVLVDGTPQAMTVPFIFLEHFQSAEDYYVSYYHAAFSRMLRLAGFFIAITLVPVYIAVLNYHPGSLSTKMIMNIALAQDSTPFSATTEAVILLLSFDLLREAGLRTPASIGQTLSIVGALVLGQSAVEANIASPSMVIAVALSGVTGLIINDLKNQIIILRLFLLAFANYAGLWGYVMGLSLIIGRLGVIKSYGVDYLSSMPFTAQGSHEDSLFRAPFPFMKRNGRFISRDGK